MMSLPPRVAWPCLPASFPTAASLRRLRASTRCASSTPGSRWVLAEGRGGWVGGWKGAPGRPSDRSATRRTRLLRTAAGPGHARQPGLRPATTAGPATSPLARSSAPSCTLAPPGHHQRDRRVHRRQLQGGARRGQLWGPLLHRLTGRVFLPSGGRRMRPPTSAGRRPPAPFGRPSGPVGASCHPPCWPVALMVFPCFSPAPGSWSRRPLHAANCPFPSLFLRMLAPAP